MHTTLLLTPPGPSHCRSSRPSTLPHWRRLGGMRARGHPLLQPDRCGPNSLRMCPAPFHTSLMRARVRTRGSRAPGRIFLFRPTVAVHTR